MADTGDNLVYVVYANSGADNLVTRLEAGDLRALRLNAILFVVLPLVLHMTAPVLLDGVEKLNEQREPIRVFEIA